MRRSRKTCYSWEGSESPPPLLVQWDDTVYTDIRKRLYLKCIGRYRDDHEEAVCAVNRGIMDRGRRAGGERVVGPTLDHGKMTITTPWKIRLIKRSVNVAPSQATSWSPFVIVRTGRFAALVGRPSSMIERCREWYFGTKHTGRGVYWLVLAGLSLPSLSLYRHLCFKNYIDLWIVRKSVVIVLNSLSFDQLSF